jgi:hypothetical protein
MTRALWENPTKNWNIIEHIKYGEILLLLREITKEIRFKVIFVKVLTADAKVGWIVYNPEEWEEINLSKSL